jgi:hypothetical protein
VNRALYADFDRVRAYYCAEGFVVGLMKCHVCKAVYEAFVHPGAPLEHLECRYCGALDSTLLPFDARCLRRANEPPPLPPPLPARSA